MTTELLSTRQQLKPYDKVICNGYPGTVTRVCEFAPGMIEVKLQSGWVCVSDDLITVQRRDS